MREDVYVRGWETAWKQKQAGEEPKAQSQKPREECLGASGSQVLLKHMGKLANRRSERSITCLQTSDFNMQARQKLASIWHRITNPASRGSRCKLRTPVFPRPSLKSVLFLSPPGEQRGRLEPNSCDNGFHSGQGASFEDCSTQMQPRSVPHQRQTTTTIPTA